MWVIHCPGVPKSVVNVGVAAVAFVVTWRGPLSNPTYRMFGFDGATAIAETLVPTLVSFVQFDALVQGDTPRQRSAIPKYNVGESTDAELGTSASGSVKLPAQPKTVMSQGVAEVATVHEFEVVSRFWSASANCWFASSGLIRLSPPSPPSTSGQPSGPENRTVPLSCRPPRIFAPLLKIPRSS